MTEITAPEQSSDRQAEQALLRLLVPMLPWIVLTLLGWAGLVLAGPLPYMQQKVQWRHGGQTLRGELWLPRPLPAGNLPGMILVHGVMSDRRQPELTARALAGSVAVLTFDLRGYGASDPAADTPENHRDDVLSALSFLRAQPGLDPHRIALLGHSMGATAVSDAAAEDGHVQMARAMGMHGEHGAQDASPVEWVTGLYDALHPPGLFKAVTISPAANHHVEWHDAWLLANHQQKLEQVFALPAKPWAWREWLRYIAHWLLGIGFTGVFALLLRSLSSPYARLAAATLPIGLLLAAGSFGLIEASAAAAGTLVLLCAYLGAQAPARLLKILGLAGLAFFVARESAALLRVLPWILPDPGRLLWFPVYLFQSLFYYPVALAHLLQGLCFRAGEQVQPHWPLALIALGEWLMPAWWLRLGQGLKMPQRRQQSSLVALGLGLAALAGLVLLRLQQGYLAGDALQQAGRVFLTDLLPTIVIFALLIRQLRKKGAFAETRH